MEDVNLEELKREAESGYAPAQNDLGLSYFNGEGVQKNDKQALFWFEQSAKRGYNEAESNLGWMYHNGFGVEEDFEKAEYWYRKAIKQGNGRAENNLETLKRLKESIANKEKYQDQEADDEVIKKTLKLLEESEGKQRFAHYMTLADTYITKYQNYDKTIYWAVKFFEEGVLAPTLMQSSELDDTMFEWIMIDILTDIPDSRDDWQNKILNAVKNRAENGDMVAIEKLCSLYKDYGYSSDENSTRSRNVQKMWGVKPNEKDYKYWNKKLYSDEEDTVKEITTLVPIVIDTNSEPTDNTPITEKLLLLKDRLSPIADMNFFIGIGEIDYNQEQIAQFIRGANYDKVKKKIDKFIDRCNQSLYEKEEVYNQLKADYDYLVSQANANPPGSPPSGLFLNRSSSFQVAMHNMAVDDYNDRLNKYNHICNLAEDARYKYNNAIERYNERKEDLEEQIDERKEDYKPALEKDILILLKNMVQFSQVLIDNKKIFDAFLVIFMAGKGYGYLYNRIDIVEQEEAEEIFGQLEQQLSSIVMHSQDSIYNGLDESVKFVLNPFNLNQSLQSEINSEFKELPFSQSKDIEKTIREILAFHIEVDFKYKSIVAPDELMKVENQVKKERVRFEQNIQKIATSLENLQPIINTIAKTENYINKNLLEMEKNKSSTIDLAYTEIAFVFTLFSEYQQDKYLKGYKGWLQEIEEKIESKYDIALSIFSKNSFGTNFLIDNTTHILEDKIFNFHLYKKDLQNKKTNFTNAIGELDEILEKIQKIPQEKATSFQTKISESLNFSFFPIIGIFSNITIFDEIKKFIPALKSTHTAYSSVRDFLIGKFDKYSKIHLVLSIIISITAIVSSVFPIFIVAIPYFISSVLMNLKKSELIELSKSLQGVKNGS